jgi:hypothetical protein
MNYTQLVALLFFFAGFVFFLLWHTHRQNEGGGAPRSVDSHVVSCHYTIIRTRNYAKIGKACH